MIRFVLGPLETIHSIIGQFVHLVMLGTLALDQGKRDDSVGGGGMLESLR